MATFTRKVPPYVPAKDVSINWDTFRRGLNTLLQDTEINKQEVAQAKNLVLVGKGVPTKRWGSQLYFQAGNATGSVRGLIGFYPSGASGTNELLALTDDGFLTKQSGASYTRQTGASWASGYNAYMTQLDNRVYIVNGQRELVRYSSPTLVGFPTISFPVITGATNLSNATGTNLKSYRITAVSQVGETLPSAAFQLANQPLDLGNPAGGTIRLTWTGVSTASGILQGFNIYGRTSGQERFLAFAPATATTFDDDGDSIPKELTFTPTADSTGGPKAKYIKRFEDRLIFAGLDGDPSKVLISGRAPNHEKFDIANGGNFIKVEPDAGDAVVQIESFHERIVVFKEKSLWQITLGTEQIGNFFVTAPQLQLITASSGCIAPKSVVPVENDVYYLAREGVRSLGNQAGFNFDVLRSNEISIAVRPYFQNLTVSELMNAVATYYKNKYIIAFPGRDEMMVYDRERTSWTGPWTLDSTVFETFYDTSGDRHLLFAQKDTVNVDEMSDSLTTDKGSAIETILRTRSEDFGDWSVFKNIKDLFIMFRNVTGSVSVEVKLETRTGAITTTKSFNVTPTSGNSGWGADLWGNTLWGNSEVTAGSTEAVYTIRWANLNKIGRTMALTFRTTAVNSNYELLGVRAYVKPLSRGFTPSSWKV